MDDPEPQPHVFISVAGNIEPERHILNALIDLNRTAPVVAVSRFYRTEALGRPDQADYLNGVVAIRTTIAPRELKFSVLRPIEARNGRNRTADPYDARTVDLDILVYGETLANEKDLKIPDPDLETRPFLGAALLELAPHLTPPGWTLPLARVVNSAGAALRPDVAYTKLIKERLLS